MQQFLKLNQTHCASTQLYRVWCADFHTENTCIRTYQLQFAVCFLWWLYDAMLASMNYIKWRERAQSTATTQRRLCQQKCIKQQQQPTTCKIVITTRIYELTNNCNIHIGQPHCNSQQFQPIPGSAIKFTKRIYSQVWKRFVSMSKIDSSWPHYQPLAVSSPSLSLFLSPPSPLSISPFHLAHATHCVSVYAIGIAICCFIKAFCPVRMATDFEVFSCNILAFHKFLQ